MQAVVEASVALEVHLNDPQARKYAGLIEEQTDVLDTSEVFPPALSKAIQYLWADPDIKSVVARQHEFQLNDRRVPLGAGAERF
jgi:hypothetical protein